MKMEAPSKEKVFITGISGFTGKHIEKYLIERGFDVFGITLNKPTKKNHYQCDILSKEALVNLLNDIKPDYIVHLAAISFVASKDLEAIYRINVFGTLSLMDALVDMDYTPKKVLIASSASVYGNVEGVLSEDMCPHPINHYGNSKLVMENMVVPYFDKLNIIIARPFNYTGVGQEPHFLVPKIMSHFKDVKEKIELGNIDVYREFNDVKMVVKYYTELLISDVKSEIVNVCSGNAVNIKEILNIMNKLSGYEINVEINPAFIRKNEIKVLKGSTRKMNLLIGDFSNDTKLEGTLLEMYKQ